MSGGPRVVTRRGLLGLGLGTAGLLGGCGGGGFRPLQNSEPPLPVTVPALVTTTPFYAAHRGGGDDWPEMTAYAYEQASRVPGLRALEVSACLSADGVLVCSHDPTTRRVTGEDLVIGEETWATLSTLQVTSAATHDPAQPARPLTRLDAVVGTYLDDFVLFVEPKVAQAVEPVMDLLAGFSQPTRVVWKQPINSTSFGEARQHGFSTWGYVLDEPGHLGTHLAAYAASPDLTMIGVSDEQPDAFIRTVVDAADANGKPTIAWPVRTTARRERALGLGCRGMMTSDPAELLAPPR